MLEKCEHLKEFMLAQKDVIERHVDDHKWFRKIDNMNAGVSDFIKEYGWLMREMYCLHACPHRGECTIVDKLRKQKERRTH